MNHPDTIVILDFGSQYTQLIARRVREMRVYCELLPYDTPVETIQRLGFYLDEPGLDLSDPDSEDLGPYVLDWDAVDQARAGGDLGHVPA